MSHNFQNEVCKRCGISEPEAIAAGSWHLPCMTTPLTKQEGSDHYLNMPIQPVEFIHKNGLGFIEGCVIKYLVRWRAKPSTDRLEDLKKARHYLDLLIEMEKK